MRIGTAVILIAAAAGLASWLAHRTATVRPRVVLQVPLAQVKALALSPDGGTLAVGGIESGGAPAVVLFDTTTGVAGRRFPTRGTAGALTFSPDGRYVAVSFDPREAGVKTGGDVLDLDKGKVLPLSAQSSCWLYFTPDGQSLLGYPPIRRSEYTVDVVWNTATWRERPSSPDGRDAPRPPAELLRGSDKGVTSSGQDIVALVDEEDPLRSYTVVDVEADRVLARFRLTPTPPAPDMVSIGDFSPDGRLVIVENLGGVYYLYDWGAGKAVTFDPGEDRTNLDGTWRYSPDSRNLVAAFRREDRPWTAKLPDNVRNWLDDRIELLPRVRARVAVWDTATGRPRIDVGWGGDTSNVAGSILYDLSSDGRTLAAECRMGVVAVWDVPPAR